jgi:hypothetical protein
MSVTGSHLSSLTQRAERCRAVFTGAYNTAPCVPMVRYYWSHGEYISFSSILFAGAGRLPPQRCVMIGHMGSTFPSSALYWMELAACAALMVHYYWSHGEHIPFSGILLAAPP